VIDGLEGMEGDGPVSGRPVPSRIAIASLITSPPTAWSGSLGIDPRWVGYLQYCEQVGIGNYESRRSRFGARRSRVARKYRLALEHETQSAVDGSLVTQ